MSLRADDATRAQAARAATALRAFIADPASGGHRSSVHLKLSGWGPKSTWIAMWSNLPGLMQDLSSGEYTHALLPGWSYTDAEMRTEMLDDLEHLARSGERPTEVTRGKRADPRQVPLRFPPSR